MTTADDRLRALFAEDAPPPRDPGFSTAVMARLARRRFQADVALLAGVSAVGGLSLWALWPVIQPALVQTSQGLASAVPLLALAGGLVWVIGGRIGAALGLEA